MKRIPVWLGAILVTVLMIASPSDSISYAHHALLLCFETLIPALFPFFVCSGILIHSGFCEMLSSLAKPIMKPIFNVNKNGASAFILGIISGYPLGAVTACQLYGSGYLSKHEAERLLSFCNNSGPLFIMGAVGASIYSEHKIGIMLYIAHILSAILVGIIFRFYKRNKHSAPEYKLTAHDKSLPAIYTDVMKSSINSIITICGSVVFFSVISGLLVAHLPIDSGIKVILSSLLEMTGGVTEISLLHLSLTTRLVISAVVIGFAGLCVHLQVVSVVCEYGLSLFPYITGKMLHGVISGMLMLILLKLFPVTNAVFSITQNSVSLGFFISSLLVCTSTLIFLILSAFSLIVQKKQISY